MTFAEQAQAITPEQFQEMVRETAKATGIESIEFVPVADQSRIVIAVLDNKLSIREIGRFVEKTEKFAIARLQYDLPTFARVVAGEYGVAPIVFEFSERAYRMSLELADIWATAFKKAGVD